MNKQKLDSIKKELRLQAPKIVGAAVIVTAVVVAYRAGVRSTHPFTGNANIIMDDGIGLAATKDMLNHMKETNDGILFQVEEGNFLLKQVDW